MTQDDARFRTHLDRERMAIVAEGDAGPLWRDLELHLLSIGAEHDPRTLRLLKDGLAALALYLVSRPRFEAFGWTVNLRRPPLNLFFTGSARELTVVGRAFHEGVKDLGRDAFFVQTQRPFGEPQTSTVDIEGRDFFGFVEQYARKSEQQPVRFFRSGESGLALLVSIPDTDRAWFDSVGVEEVFARIRGGKLQLIGDRGIAFLCGCDTERIARLVAGLFKDDPEGLFRSEPSVEAECPRCGAKHTISRERFDRALAES